MKLKYVLLLGICALPHIGYTATQAPDASTSPAVMTTRIAFPPALLEKPEEYLRTVMRSEPHARIHQSDCLVLIYNSAGEAVSKATGTYMSDDSGQKYVLTTSHMDIPEGGYATARFEASSREYRFASLDPNLFLGEADTTKGLRGAVGVDFTVGFLAENPSHITPAKLAATHALLPSSALDDTMRDKKMTCTTGGYGRQISILTPTGHILFTDNPENKKSFRVLEVVDQGDLLGRLAGGQVLKAQYPAATPALQSLALPLAPGFSGSSLRLEDGTVVALTMSVSKYLANKVSNPESEFVRAHPYVAKAVTTAHAFVEKYPQPYLYGGLAAACGATVTAALSGHPYWQIGSALITAGASALATAIPSIDSLLWDNLTGLGVNTQFASLVKYRDMIHKKVTAHYARLT